MGFDYALVHVKYTIPVAVVLAFLYRPLYTRIDLYKILFLTGIAVTATTPWDSYLIRQKIWTYPPSVIVGPTLFSIPVEEVFFFVVQTFNTSVLYLLVSKPIFKPSYLIGPGDRLFGLKARKYAGQVLIASLIALGTLLVRARSEGTYLGLILVWAGPFALLLWTLAYQFLLKLPALNTLVPIAIPTLYLWIVDTLALKRGTWTIESGTKLGIHVWDGLEIEEAIFFLATNILIVFGLVAFDNALAVLEAFPARFPTVSAMPSPFLLVRALVIDPAQYDKARISGIQDSISRLKKKSRSFYLASSVFSGRLRIDLILLYSFCRVADDLIDESTNEEATLWLSKLSNFLDLSYASLSPSKRRSEVERCVVNDFPPGAQSALLLLPTSVLSRHPLCDLLDGFRTDLDFSRSVFPIRTEDDLILYSRRVAGTVAELCIELVFQYSPSSPVMSASQRDFLIRSGGQMGIALQYVNISRDVVKDAAIGRVYLPTAWLEEEGFKPQHVIQHPRDEKVEKLRTRLLVKAFAMYREAKDALAQLPNEARAPMTVAIESYMEIGRVMQENGYELSADKATVPKMRRIKVAWKALNGS
ncbi:MAG: hypothetical protein M1818_004823 [Claussenomyces sp. TS43310]|nr:MAG: hypothetical protein M1818_004823 [Claussenomyces sp. TS43310]